MMQYTSLTRPPATLRGTTILDNDKNLRILYHGTTAFFSSFSDKYLQSLGFHFGCITQAKYFASRAPKGRIIAAYILARKLADVRPSDCAWLQTQGAVICLQDCGFLSSKEADELLDGGERSLAAHRGIESQEERRALNAKIITFLKAKGYDGIVCSNRQEPPDGIRRDAYLIFRAEQIFPVASHETRQTDHALPVKPGRLI